MNSFEDVVFFHELLTVFLESDELVKGDKIMIGFDEVVCVIEVFVDLKEYNFGEERVILFEGEVNRTFREVVFCRGFQ